MMTKKTREHIIEFLKTQEKELKRNDLNAVYNNLPRRIAKPQNLTEVLFDLKIDPLDYFKGEIPFAFAANMNLLYPDVKIKPTIKIIEEFAFYNSGIEKLYIPASVTSVGYASFCDCERLKEIYIDGCPVFEEDAFDSYVGKFQMNCSREEFDKVNPELCERYVKAYNIHIEFLK